ncbi:MAG TPA: DUF362 domain-containing protein [Deltaproteobacteria bacterium]|nr:DUF362 domain-containing protein [Deltaproteobacteria bacterium]
MTRVSIQKATYGEPGIERLLGPLGGMGNFVEEGDRVLLKVNLLSAREPEKAVTTHPALVRAVALAVRDAGGRPYIGDSPAGRFSERALRKAYKKTGLEALSKEEGIPLNWDTNSRRVDIRDGLRLKQVPVCNFVLEADKIIALPKLKTHSLQFMTLACKITYGAVPGLTKARYHGRFPRRAAFADMILDIMACVSPRLYVMDGILAMEGQGPGSGDPVNLGWLLASTDPVAMDISVCRLLGIEPVAIPVLKRAKVRGLWPEAMEYPLLAPGEIGCQGFKLPNTTDHLLTEKKQPNKRPLVTERCIGCGECREICPKEAIQIEGERASIDRSKCISCFCCHEVCPEKAIELVAERKG